MQRIVILLVSILSFSICRADLKQRFAEELSAGQAYPCGSLHCPSQESIESYQYFFIDGFVLGKGHNFIPSMTVLTNEFGVKDKILIKPESRKSISENAQIIYQQIMLARAKSTHKKALIVAHSKGAAETLLMALHHPDMYASGLVTDLVLVDGAFNGTPLADLWIDVCKNSRVKPTRSQAEVCSTIDKFQAGLVSLKPGHVIPIFQTAMNRLDRSSRVIVSGHIWSIESQWGDFADEWRSPLWGPHLYLQRLYGNNDGVIPTENQKLPQGFGTDLGEFLADHNSLLNRGRTAADRKVHEAFARALIREMIYTRK